MNIFKVKNLDPIGHNIVLLTLQPKRDRDKLAFYPGQYAAIGYKNGSRPSPMRCFSIVSSPNATDALQFAMRIYGDFTTTLSQLNEGDTVFVHGPFGNFVVDEQYDRNLIFFAGGIGITPFMSMLRYAAETKLRTPITLLYSSQTQDNIPFYDELLRLQQQNPQFKIAFFITNGDSDKLSGSRVLKGRISEDRINQLSNNLPGHTTYFICGPASFKDHIESTLLSKHIDPDRIVTEEFSSSNQLKAISLVPKHSISKWTYGLTGASLIAGTMLIMSIDLVRAVPRIVNAESNQTTTTTRSITIKPSTTSSPSSSSSSSNSSVSNTQNTGSATNQTTNSSNSNNSSTSNSTNQTSNQSTQRYQSPVTSVS